MRDYLEERKNNGKEKSFQVIDMKDEKENENKLS